MGIRSVNYELEAKLAGAAGLFSKPAGKLERKSYGDGGERLKISFKKLKVPDRATAIVTVDRVEVARVTVVNGSARFDEESGNPHAMPQLKAGQLVEVTIEGEPVLQGRLYED